MPPQNQDHKSSEQPIESRLRRALHEHAQDVSPSPEAFFTINQRISRREAASSFNPRVLWEKRARLQVQPSLVFSLVLLVALSVVTTLLITQNNSATQTVQVATPGETQPDPDGPATASTLPDGSDNGSGGAPAPSESVDVITGPTATRQPNPTTSAASSLPAPATTSAADPTSQQPPGIRLLSPETYEVRPLQVASNGFPVVYSEHRLDSQQIATIPVVSPDGPFSATSNIAVDNDGTLWIEVLDPQGETGWVLSQTVSVQPTMLTADQDAQLTEISRALVDLVGLAEIGGVDQTLLDAAGRELLLSSRGTYVALATNEGAVHGYSRYDRDVMHDYLLGRGADGEVILEGLRDALTCLSQSPSVVGPSDIEPPGALQKLNYVALTNGGACNLLVYFDFFQERPEIIALSVHR